MNGSIFLCGKPYNMEMFPSKGAFDSLEERIKEWVESHIASIPDDTLIVETYNWRGACYSVYTYFTSRTYDSANRQNGYGVISLILKGEYSTRISGIYKLLHEAFWGGLSQIGVFDRKAGKYVCHSFSDKEAAIDKLLREKGNLLASEYTQSLLTIDTSFIAPKKEGKVLYSPKDCDSEAFRDKLKACGRIFVSASEPSKDDRLAAAQKQDESLESLKKAAANAEGLRKENADQKKKLAEKDSEITEKQTVINNQATEIERLKKELNDTDRQLKTTVDKLEEPLKTLLKKFEAVRSDGQSQGSLWWKALFLFLRSGALVLLLNVCALFFFYHQFVVKKNVSDEFVGTELMEKVQPTNDLQVDSLSAALQAKEQALEGLCRDTAEFKLQIRELENGRNDLLRQIDNLSRQHQAAPSQSKPSKTPQGTGNKKATQKPVAENKNSADGSKQETPDNGANNTSTNNPTTKQ